MMRLLRKRRSHTPLGLPGFDPEYYLRENKDVAAAGRDPVDHFLEYGWREGRNPSPHFDVAAYISDNPDVAATQMNPYVHFLNHGLKEGRLLGDMKAKLDAISGELHAVHEREALAVRISERRRVLLRDAQITSSVAMAGRKADAIRIRELNKQIKKIQTRVSHLNQHIAGLEADKSRFDAQVDLWAELFEQQARSMAFPHLPCRAGRSLALRTSSLGKTDAMTLIDLFHRTVGVAGDVLSISHSDALVPELLDQEVESDLRNVFVGLVMPPVTWTDKDGKTVAQRQEPTGLPGDQLSSRRRLIAGSLEQILASNLMTARVSLALIELDSYALTKFTLQEIDELMPPGGFLLVGRDGHSSRGPELAITEFLEARPETWIRDRPALAVKGLTIMGKVA